VEKTNCVKLSETLWLKTTSNRNNNTSLNIVFFYPLLLFLTKSVKSVYCRKQDLTGFSLINFTKSNFYSFLQVKTYLKILFIHKL